MMNLIVNIIRGTHHVIPQTRYMSKTQRREIRIQREQELREAGGCCGSGVRGGGFVNAEMPNGECLQV